ncbi:hypothetical protein AVEN_275185-1 [Araneus ventricosus]|uniref:Uncharacterized protein n=1 Tax=Araneus ventricosus TaxID=182803 RepID=A0A4Y2RFC9_ARAVE|nr:hypothetical protein AVEN_275185-1 [Araneus ventricosus]
MSYVHNHILVVVLITKGAEVVNIDKQQSRSYISSRRSSPLEVRLFCLPSEKQPAGHYLNIWAFSVNYKRKALERLQRKHSFCYPFKATLDGGL